MQHTWQLLHPGSVDFLVFSRGLPSLDDVFQFSEKLLCAIGSSGILSEALMKQ